MSEERIAELRTQIERSRQQLYRSEARLEELERQQERLSHALHEAIGGESQEGAQLEGESIRSSEAVNRLAAEAAEMLGHPGPVALAELRGRLNRVRMELAQRMGQRQRIEQDREGCQAELLRHREQGLILEQSALLLQQTADHARNQAKTQIEALVTATLRSVFGPEYSFSIELVERAGRPEAEFFVLSACGGEQLKTRLQDSRGGGVIDIVSLGLRIAMLETYRPKLEGALILDEPAKHVSDDYIQGTARLFQKVSEGFGRQVIMVTHDTHLAETAQVAYQVVLKEERSVVTRTLSLPER